MRDQVRSQFAKLLQDKKTVLEGLLAGKKLTEIAFERGLDLRRNK